MSQKGGLNLNTLRCVNGCIFYQLNKSSVGVLKSIIVFYRVKNGGIEKIIKLLARSRAEISRDFT